MAAPTFVSEYESPTWDRNAGTSVTKTGISVTVGDRIVVIAAAEGNETISSVSDTDTNSWTSQANLNQANACGARCWTATAKSTTTISITVLFSSTTAAHGFDVAIWNGSYGFGSIATALGVSGTPSLALTSQGDNSAIDMLIADFNAIDGGSRAWLSINSSAGTELVYFRNSAAYTVYANRWNDAGSAGSKTTGLSAPAGQVYTIISIEILGSDPPAPAVIGVGAQAVSTTSGGSVSAAYPAGYTAIADDYCVIVGVGKHNNGSSLAPNDPSGYSQLGTRFRELGTYDLQVTAWIKKLTAGESAPALTVPAAYSSTSGGLTAQCLILRNLDPTTVLDGSVIASDGAAPASPFDITPTGLTTGINKALVLSILGTADDNALGLQTAQSFTAQMSGANYDTTTGGDVSVGVATRVVPTAGAVTMPTWRETVLGGDAWAHLAVSLRPTPTGAFSSKINIGDTLVSAMKLGDTAVLAAYLGDTQVL